MNVKLVLVSALVAGGMITAGMAQTAGPQAPATPAAASATPAPTAPPPPQAIPAKIAVIEFEEVAAATNEGQKAVAEIQKKFEPQKNALDTLKAEIDTLTKQLQNAPATMSDDEKASRARTIDTKQKQWQRDGEDAQTAYASDVQEAVSKIEEKLGPVVMKYVQQNGFTMLLNNAGPPQQGGLSLLWGPGTDISAAVVDAYNASSGVAAPAVTRPRPAAPKPAAPKPAAPKQ
jgi:outer membrane protein